MWGCWSLIIVTYMYFVNTYVYNYNNWSPYLGCGLLFSLCMTVLQNLGFVGYLVRACTVLWLHRLVVNYLLSCGCWAFLVGLWHNFLYFEPACAA